MLHSKIPVRVPPKLPDVSENKKRPTTAWQKAKLVRKGRTAETKQSYQVSKDKIVCIPKQSKPFLGNAQNKNTQHKLTEDKRKQDSQPCFRDRNKNILKKDKKEGTADIPQNVLKELNENKKPIRSDEKGQQPKMVKGKNSVPSLKIGSKKSTNPTNIRQTCHRSALNLRNQKKVECHKTTNNPTNIQQTYQRSVSNVRNQKKVECPKTTDNPTTIQQTHQRSVSNVRNQKKVERPETTDNHPSQPDIEFEPDQNCLNRILSGRELSPGILKMPPRMQSSIYRKFSIHKPITVPTDPFKTMLKALENMDSTARRISVKKPDFQASPVLERCSPFHRKPPINAFEIATRRLTELKLKEKLKSARKVTFKLPDSDLKPTASENESKHRRCQLPLMDASDPSSQHSTPELDGNIGSYAKISSYGSQLIEPDNEKTPTITSVPDIISRIRQQNNEVNSPNIKEINKMPSSILRRNNTTAATDCEERRVSLFCSRVLDSNFKSRKLRRSTSASELSRSPPSTSAKTVLLDASSKFSCKIDLGRSNQVERSSSLHPSLNTKMLRTSISSPELREMFPCSAAERRLENSSSSISSKVCSANKLGLFSQMQNPLLYSQNKDLHIRPATDCDERRISLFCSRVLDSNFRSRKLRRSTSASELSRSPPSTSAKTVLLDASSKFSNKIGTGRSNQVERSNPLHPFQNNKGLRTSISSPELREMFPYIAEGGLENSKSSIASKVCSANKLGHFSQMQNPLLYSQSKDSRIRPCNVLANSIKAEQRGSLYLPHSKNVIQSNNNRSTSKLCTPCPVSFYPKSSVADSFSPEFLCRTSNIIYDAPIRTPLMMRNLAERDQIDNVFSPVRQKLDFETLHKETEYSKVTSQAYLQTFKTQQIIMDSLADQECCVILSHAVSSCICIRDLSNPIAKTLEYGDEMDLLQKATTMFNSTQSGERQKLLKDKYDHFPPDYSVINTTKGIHNSLAMSVNGDLSNLKRPQIYTIGNDAMLQRTPSFDPANRVTLSWHNINVFVKPKKSKIFNFRNQYDLNAQKQLLFGVSGEVKPGQLLAIMGASGAGKTTLLNVLTSRNLRLLNVDGEVLVNGQNVGESMTRISAYVQQDDLFIGTLTVKEHLIFQALLRMDKHLSYSERMKRVDEVILELGLSKCVNTMIGVAGRIKGISGGEAKRLAFAAEVLTNPALMFCDEPTSGLDSFMSQSIVTVLRSMAQGGRTIICTIHQPSSEVYELFDHLLLMAEGRVAYKGKASKAIDFFERAGLHCPINYNPADFFVHTLAIVPGKEVESREKVSSICDQFSKESQNFEASASIGYSFTDSQIKPRSRYKASWCRQFKAVVWRSWLSLIREPMLTKVRFMQSTAIGLLFGLVYWRQVLDEKGIMNINGAIFLLLMNTTFQNMFAVVNVFTLEQPIFLREHWNGMYRTDVYFLSKTITEAPVLVFMTLVYGCIVYWMIGLNPSYSAFLICLAILILVANTAASFGYMVSCLSSSMNVALSIATPLIMPLVLFGGFYLNADSVPVYFIWLKYISWFYYGNEALAINQWKDVTYIDCSTPVCPPNGTVVLQSLNFHEEYFLRDVGLIVILMVFFRILAFFGLLIKSSRKT